MIRSLPRWVKVIGVLALALATFFIFSPHYTNRFRLTIEVETPEGVKSGSSVIETAVWESGNWGPVEARGIRTSTKGDAVFVELGHGRNLTALLGFGPVGSDQSRIYSLTRAALAPGKDVNWQDEPKLKGRGELPEDFVPTLVTFTDLGDPRSARVVKPADFEKVFGPGFKFRRAILETTRDSITWSIDKKMPWWSSPGRPAADAYFTWKGGVQTGSSVEPERLFRRD